MFILIKVYKKVEKFIWKVDGFYWLRRKMRRLVFSTLYFQLYFAVSVFNLVYPPLVTFGKLGNHTVLYSMNPPFIQCWLSALNERLELINRIYPFRFIEKVKNGSFHLSNEFYKPYEKCGKLMDFDGDIFAILAAYELCYSKSQNFAFSSNPFVGRFLWPCRLYISEFFLFFQFSFWRFLWYLSQ